MKLILCPKCSDVIKLTESYQTCECGKSAGNYIDDLNAEIFGKAIPIGVANESFIQALRNQPESGQGKTFTAFVIPKKCPTIKVHKKIKSEPKLLSFEGDEPDDSLK